MEKGGVICFSMRHHRKRINCKVMAIYNGQELSYESIHGKATYKVHDTFS